MKHACIARHRGEYPVRLMCRVLCVSPAGFYAAQRRAPSARARTDERLRLAVRTVHAESRHTYGAPRVHAELRHQGTRVSRKRVARLMREDGLVARAPKRRRATRTAAGPSAPPAANHLARRFAVASVPGPDRIWVGDMTFVPTRTGWLYLAVLLDLASRRVVGWATSATPDRTLALAALQRALALRQPAPGLVHHTDRGSPYTSGVYQALLAARGITGSMSRAGNCWDNAVAESFFATLEHELIAPHDWATRWEAHRAIGTYIEGWYNPKRRHSSLGYRSPMQYEARLVTRAA